MISDGRELHSTASYSDVLKVLLTQQSAVYAIGVGSAAFPDMETWRSSICRRMGYSDILPKYTNATAGEYITDNSRDAIETAYAKSMGEARNQYTLGYTTHGPTAKLPRDRSDGERPRRVKVYAKDGYYPAAPAR